MSNTSNPNVVATVTVSLTATISSRSFVITNCGSSPTPTDSSASFVTLICKTSNAVPVSFRLITNIAFADTVSPEPTRSLPSLVIFMFVSRSTVVPKSTAVLLIVKSASSGVTVTVSMMF